jgi:hypothetical protein
LGIYIPPGESIASGLPFSNNPKLLFFSFLFFFLPSLAPQSTGSAIHITEFVSSPFNHIVSSAHALPGKAQECVRCNLNFGIAL